MAEENGGGDENLDNSIRPSPFGKWLTKTRLEKHWTVEKLARDSHISMPAIYNIESGRTQNPIRNTRKALEGALQTVTPAQIVEETDQESKISGLGSLQGFDPYDLDQVPQISGIYVFYDISERPVYVGRSKDIKRRIRSHQDRFWFKRPIVDSASYVEVVEDDLRRKLEEVLIRFLKSNAVLNQNLVDRDTEE